MAFPLAVDRRTRRRRRVFLIVVIAIVVTVVVLAVRHRTEEREASDYLAVAEELASDELEMSATLTALLTSIGDLERPDILARLETLGESADQARRSLQDVKVPRPVAKASGLFAVAIESWGTAVASLGDAVVSVLDAGEGDETGARVLARAFVNLRVGDAAYQQFLMEVAELDLDIAPRDFPAVGYASGNNEPLFDAAVIATRLSVIRKLVEKHDVAVVGKFEPELVTDPNGLFVLPVAESYTVVAVITNEGNVGEEAIELSLRLLALVGEESRIERTELIPFLESGEATSVLFDDLPLEQGLAYEMRLVVSIVDEAEPEDNTFELPFFTNEVEE